MNKFLFIAIALVFLFSSCKETKKVAASKGKKLNVKLLDKNMQDADFAYDYFSAKARVNFNNGEINQSFTANIRIKKNDVIWLSLTGPFGIEGARVLIEKDRIQVVNRLNGEYIDQPLSYLNKYLPFPIDFTFIENVLVGNSFKIAETGKQKVKMLSNFYELQESEQNIDALYHIDFDYKYTKATFIQDKEQRIVDLNYKDYKIIDDQLFAFFRELVYTDQAVNNGLAMSFKFSRVKKEKSIDFPFSVPEKYRN